MEEAIKYQFPIVTLKRVKPLLSVNEKVFAYEIDFAVEKGLVIKAYENKGLDLNIYLGQQVECLLEITKGKFEYKSVNHRLPENAFSFKYQWKKRAYEFLPELVTLDDELQKATPSNEESLQAFFETTASNVFNGWGLNGLQIEIYQDKPVLCSQYGFFLINEYEFEEEIENLELGQEVIIRIDEAFLRGIRPCKGLKEPNNKEKFKLPEQHNTSLQLNQKETSTPLEHKEKSDEIGIQEESKEQKKRKFFFD